MQQAKFKANSQINQSSKNSFKIISIFHLIVWLFVIDEDTLSQQEIKQIVNMYGKQKNTINPICSQKFAFMKVYQHIKAKNPNCIIKIVVDWRNAKDILKIVSSNEKIYHQVYQVYVLADVSSVFTADSRDGSKEQTEYRDILSYHKFSRTIDNIQQILEIALREVHDSTKSYRTFNNCQVLSGKYEKFVNMYRFRLMACINIKISDHQSSMNNFIQSAKSEFFCFSELDPAKNSFSKFKSDLKQYQQNAKQFNNLQYMIATKQVKLTDQEINSKTLQFNHFMIGIYQKEGFFYQLINNYLRSIIKPQIRWQNLALPFSHVYNSIKNLYLLNIKRQLSCSNNENKFYTKDFYVWRIGRIRKNEVNQFQKIKGKSRFVEFYGFMSTSLDLKLIVDKMIDSRQSIDDFQDKTYQYCIFKIHVKVNPQIYKSKYKHLLHGYYKLDQNQPRGETQKEIVFNALNIFCFETIQQKSIKSIFNREKIVIQSLQTKSNIFLQQNNKYFLPVWLIQLNYDKFYDILLQEDQSLLTASQIKVKENYLYSMRKIKKYDKFDFADAYQETNEIHKSKVYLQSKINGSQIENSQDSNSLIYEISKIDNKNYFLRLSNVYNKLGKVPQALKLAKLSIQCYKHLQNIEIEQLYMKHYQKLFKMKTKIIEICQQSEDYLQIQIQLQKSKKQLKNKDVSNLELKQSEIELLQAVNYFSMGKLHQCLKTFKHCSKSIDQAISKIKEMVEFNEQFCCQDWLINMICGKNGVRYFKYSDFANARKIQSIKQLELKYGGQEQLQSNKISVREMSDFAIQALNDQKKVFAKEEQYQVLITSYNNKLKETMVFESSMSKQSKKECQIKDMIKKLKKIEIDSEQYKNEYRTFTQKVRQLEKLRNNHLQNTSSTEFDQLFIQKFMERQTKRKLSKLQDKKKRIQYMHRISLKEEYERFTHELQKNIKDLKYQGYADCAIKMTQMRSKLANISYIFEDYEKSYQEVQHILSCEKEESDQRNMQLAKAFKLRGKLKYKKNLLKQSLDDFNQAISYYKVSKFEQQQKYPEHLQSQISQIQLRPQQMHYDKNKYLNQHENMINNSDDYIETRLWKCKAQIQYIKLLRKEQNYKKQVQSQLIYSIKNNKMVHSDHYFSQIEMELIKIQAIINEKLKLYEMSELRSFQLEVQANFYLLYDLANPDYEIYQRIFDKFNASIKLRNNIYGVNNTDNAIMCSELITNYSKNNLIKDLIISNKYVDIIANAYDSYSGNDFYWKVVSAAYYLAKDKDMKRKYLKETIKCLQKIKKSDQHLNQEYFRYKTIYQNQCNESMKSQRQQQDKQSLQFVELPGKSIIKQKIVKIVPRSNERQDESYKDEFINMVSSLKTKSLNKNQSYNINSPLKLIKSNSVSYSNQIDPSKIGRIIKFSKLYLNKKRKYSRKDKKVQIQNVQQYF